MISFRMFEFLKSCYMFLLKNSIGIFIDKKMPLKLLLEKSKPPKQGLINGAVRFQRAPFDCLKSSPICGQDEPGVAIIINPALTCRGIGQQKLVLPNF